MFPDEQTAQSSDWYRKAIVDAAQAYIDLVANGHKVRLIDNHLLCAGLGKIAVFYEKKDRNGLRTYGATTFSFRHSRHTREFVIPANLPKEVTLGPEILLDYGGVYGRVRRENGAVYFPLPAYQLYEATGVLFQRLLSTENYLWEDMTSLPVPSYSGGSRFRAAAEKRVEYITRLELEGIPYVQTSDDVFVLD